MPTEKENKKPAVDGSRLVRRDERGRLMPGSVLNPTGPEPGTKKFATVFRDFMRKIADDKHMTAEEAEEILLKAGYDEAARGNFPFWKYIHDRLYPHEAKNDKTQVNVNVNSDADEAKIAVLASQIDEFIINRSTQPKQIDNAGENKGGGEVDHPRVD